jgi:CBS domain-containing protein
MSACPSCGHDNIAGADECSHCQQTLVFLTKPHAKSVLERNLQKDAIAALAPHEPVLVHRDTTLDEVLRRMVNWKIGSVLVVDGQEQLVGIFTERDALLRIGANIAAVKERPVSEFMTSAPVVVSIDDPVAHALHKMDLGGCRHLPVLREGRVCGVISVRDVLEYCSQRLLQEQS